MLPKLKNTTGIKYVVVADKYHIFTNAKGVFLRVWIIACIGFWMANLQDRQNTDDILCTYSLEKVIPEIFWASIDYYNSIHFHILKIYVRNKISYKEIIV